MILFCHCAESGNAEIGNLRDWLDEQIKSGNKSIAVPKDVYHLDHKNKTHLQFRNLENVTIDFNGSEIICRNTTTAIKIDRCKSLTLSNFSIDYDPLPFTQGIINRIAPDFSWFDIRILKGYPTKNILLEKGEVFDPDTHTLKANLRTFYNLSSIAKQSNSEYRIHLKQFRKYNIKTGDILVLGANSSPTSKGTSPHGIISSDCENLAFKNVTMYSSNCFAFLENRCSKSLYQECRIARKKEDAAKEFPRMRSTNADAFHSSSSEIGPTLLNCEAHFMGDDALNIRGSSYVALEANDSQMHILDKHSMDIQPGDPLIIKMH